MNPAMVLKSTFGPELKTFRVRSKEEFVKTEKSRISCLISQRQFSKKKLTESDKQIVSVYNPRPPLLGASGGKKY